MIHLLALALIIVALIAASMMTAPTGRLIGQDQVVLIFDGGAFSLATGPTYGSSIGVGAQAKTVHLDQKGNTADCRGCGDGFKQLRPTYSEFTITLTLRIENTGPIVLPVNYYGKVSLNLQSSLTPAIYEGICTANNYDGTMDEPQEQVITIEGPANTV